MRNFLFWLCCSGLLIGLCLTKRIPMGKPIPSSYPLNDTAYLQVYLSGINKAADWSMGMEEPLEGVYQLQQDPSDPTHYSYTDAVTMIDLYYDSSRTDLTVVTYVGGYQFLSPSAGPDESLVFNERTSRYTGGSAFLVFP